MRSDDGRLDVDGVVPHPPQLHGLLQSPDHEQSVVSLCSNDTNTTSAAAGLREKKGKDTEEEETSVGVGELGAPQEPQVARPGPDRLSVPEAESGVEVIGLENLLTVTAVVPAAVMSAVHPDLQEEHLDYITETPTSANQLTAD